MSSTESTPPSLKARRIRLSASAAFKISVSRYSSTSVPRVTRVVAELMAQPQQHNRQTKEGKSRITRTKLQCKSTHSVPGLTTTSQGHRLFNNWGNKCGVPAGDTQTLGMGRLLDTRTTRQLKTNEGSYLSTFKTHNTADFFFVTVYRQPQRSLRTCQQVEQQDNNSTLFHNRGSSYISLVRRDADFLSYRPSPSLFGEVTVQIWAEMDR